ncbi:hypothetical protein B0J13DRAFT_661607 [Dactylonectria estremocensis]|uniref:DUF7703 domain-containing protein n=1 Tax=Dactylonectria estremocensis TaxID=1079267 RepID=A0A9P9D1I5_9HYPO|nr:hypothetical protein B0J13DRAFT_661607 [Dactylonectria estremocensis]
MAVKDTDNDSVLIGPTAFVVACFLAISMYNFIELNFIILTTFKRRSGLYFWSFIFATWGILFYSIGFILKNFRPSTNSYVYVTFIIFGWWPLVTGQSAVLYSRLHLILDKRSWLKAVRMMIIINVIICHLPTTVLAYGANCSNPGPFVVPYSIYEKIQITIFFFQEMIISGLYIFETTKILRLTAIAGLDTNRRNQYLLRHLLIVSIIVAALDGPILALEYANLYRLQTSYKVFVYSVKLKFEFSILNRLVEVVKARENSTSFAQTTEAFRRPSWTIRKGSSGKPSATDAENGRELGNEGVNIQI